ncbi:MAG: 3-hydroxyacyl-CoA dehydrogenase family protein [Planctomycetota bacterium]|jgi:3-hydroxybutyryl-CoA dehydrogenase
MKHNEGATIAVIGAGTMGRGIAQVFAQSGYTVQLFDVVAAALSDARSQIKKLLDKAVAKEKITSGDAEAALGRLSFVEKMDDLGKVALIVEAATEKPDVKVAILKQVQAHLDEGGILASNTSSISITQLAAETGAPERFIGMHFFNPVPVMKLVEVVRGLQTDDETVKQVIAYAESVGKIPVQCNDHPGFVSNRVLMPMINEAVFTLQDGVATAEAIDDIMKLGMAHPMGPLALADLIGLDVCLFILEVLHRDLGEDRYRPCPLLRKMVQAGRLGRKSKHGFYKYE